MNYLDYKAAAEKHIKTCEAIIDSINKLTTLDATALIITSGKQHVLHNLFYLTGYILESITTYAVYKHYGWRQSKSIHSVDTNFSQLCQFSFHPKDGFQYFAHGHNFKDNQMEVLKIPFGSSSIPIIDSSISVDLDLQAMLRVWEPKLRYNSSTTNYPYILTQQFQINENNSVRFFELSKKIFNGLMQQVG